MYAYANLNIFISLKIHEPSTEEIGISISKESLRYHGNLSSLFFVWLVIS